MQLAIEDLIRAFVHTPYVTAYPSVPILYENGPFDWNSPPPFFVELEIKLYDGRPIGMSATPKTRLHGCVYVTTYAKKGSGNRTSKALLDWFFNHLKYQNAGAVRLQEPSPVDGDRFLDWYTEGLKVEFYADET